MMNENNLDIDKCIWELGILLGDPMSGLMQQALENNWNEQYSKDFDLATTWDCFQSDVNRINNVLLLHDFLCDISLDTWKFIQTDDPNDLNLEYKSIEWLNRLKERIENEITSRERIEK